LCLGSVRQESRHARGTEQQSSRSRNNARIDWHTPATYATERTNEQTNDDDDDDDVLPRQYVRRANGESPAIDRFASQLCDD
jgi:hypothetical protein